MEDWPLSTDEVYRVRALLNRIIPADDWPGAVDVGVDRFLRNRLTDEPSLVDFYRSGLMIFPASAFNSDGELDSAIQELESHPFIRLLIQHSLEGYYADPGNGGNRDAISWNMIGFEVTA